MRAFEFLYEKTSEQPNLSNLKTQIIGQVKKTQDPDLLQKLYTTLNKGGLVDRIAPVLDRDTDTKGYVKDLVNMIIDVEGTYEEKQSFINEYPNGYIDIKKMLSGEYVRFNELIVGGETAPLAFVLRVFNALKQVTFGGAKGPGEFGLAVLSPHIKITAGGDLKIGDKTIEVKAMAGESGGGGRVGTPGLLASDNIAEIIKKHIPKFTIEKGTGLNLKQFSDLMNVYRLNPAKKRALATELFKYIFRGEADTSGIVDAVISGNDPSPYYLKANYEIYQKESQFDGMMLINFKTQALKYFVDPLQMANEIYAMSVYLISGNPGFQSRQILAQVSLRKVKEPKAAPAPAKKSVKEPATIAKKVAPIDNTQINTQQPQPNITPTNSNLKK